MEARFDEIVHAPNRLRICSLLATTGTAEFGTIRDMLGVADSVTSKQLKVLADAGYVRLSKRTGSGSRAKTWATITGRGARPSPATSRAFRSWRPTPPGPDPERRPRAPSRQGAWPSSWSAVEATQARTTA